MATLRDLDAAIGLLGWDEETYLPERAHAQRGEQLATLESLRHRLLLDPELHDVAAELVETHADDRLLRREVELLGRQRRIASLAAWEDARRRRDFGVFLEPFSSLLGLVRERGQALARGREVYDGLLDEHEPGLTRGGLAPILRTLARDLAPLVRSAAEHSRHQPHPLAGRSFPEAAQRELAKDA